MVVQVKSLESCLTKSAKTLVLKEYCLEVLQKCRLCHPEKANAPKLTGRPLEPVPREGISEGKAKQGGLGGLLEKLASQLLGSNTLATGLIILERRSHNAG